jgi:MFS family permease
VTRPGAVATDLSVERRHSGRGGLADSSTFGSLAIRNFRLFSIGQSVSMTGLGMQRVAQDWLILELTDSVTAVGLVMAIQCLPTLVLGVVGGAVGDRYPRRRVLLATQVAMAGLAGALALLTLTGSVATWQVYLIAFVLGLVSVVDNPARQAFVIEMVGPDRVRNAVGINSSVFQLGGFIGPAMAGLTITAVGVGAAFALNALSYAAPILALWLMRESELRSQARPGGTGIGPRPKLREVVKAPQILWPLVLVAALGFFAPNLPVTLAALTIDTLHAGPGWYGLLNAVVAVGSVAGALCSARLRSMSVRILLIHGAMVSAAYVTAASTSSAASLSVALFCVGGATLLLMTGANAMVLLATPRALQGRAMGLYLLVVLGSAAVGGPALGLVNEHLGPRIGLLLPGFVMGAVVIGVATATRTPRTPKWSGCGVTPLDRV